MSFTSLFKPSTDANRVMFAGLTQAQLEEAFDLVKPQANWKDPIGCHVPLTQEQVVRVLAAVPYFTGGPATIVPYGYEDAMPITYRVTAAGYYACIGA